MPKLDKDLAETQRSDGLLLKNARLARDEEDQQWRTTAAEVKGLGKGKDEKGKDKDKGKKKKKKDGDDEDD